MIKITPIFSENGFQEAGSLLKVFLQMSESFPDRLFYFFPPSFSGLRLITLFSPCLLLASPTKV